MFADIALKLLSVIRMNVSTCRIHKKIVARKIAHVALEI